jgi:hypothetical protein
MSKTYSLINKYSKTYVWVGQGRNQMNPVMEVLYAGNKDVMRDLEAFLSLNEGVPLVLVDDEHMDHVDYTEFKAPADWPYRYGKRLWMDEVLDKCVKRLKRLIMFIKSVQTKL